MTTEQALNSESDPIRRLAFDHLFALPGAESTRMREDLEAELENLPPTQRTRAINIASRRLAFQVLYEFDVAQAADPTARVVTLLASVTTLGEAAAEQVKTTVLGALANKATADAEFARLAPEWPTHRQAAVDRAVLRLAHYELTKSGVPGKVVINEAVELARWYSTEKSPAFINGLLDRVLTRTESERTSS